MSLRATAFGWHAAVQGFGALAAGVFFGLLWQFFGAPVAFLTGASLALVARRYFSGSGPRHSWPW